jgi:hypothetical protein
MEDVACTVMNRVAAARAFIAANGRCHPLFGDGSPASACLKPEQFSCWNPGDPNRAIIEALGPESAIFRQATNIAEDAIAGALPDRTNGATHYKRIGSYAKWAEGHTPCFTEGHHEFFNDIP